LKLEAKGAEKTTQNFLSKFNVTGSRDTTSGAIQGEIKNTLTCLLNRPISLTKDLANLPMLLESTSTLTTDGSVTQQVELKDPLIKGLNLSTTGQFVSNGPLNVKVNMDYSQVISSNTFCTKNVTLDLSKNSKLVSEGALRYNGFVLGAQANLSASSMALENYSAAFGYELNHYKATIHALSKGTLMAACFYQKFTSGVETGFKATWNRKTANQYAIDLVAKFPLDHGSWLKCKLDNTGKVGVAYTTALNNKVSLTMAAAFDTLKNNDLQQNHRLGMGLVVDF